MFYFFRKKVIENIVVIDSSFPEKIPSGFRNYEINGLLTVLKDCKCYTMSPTKPKKHAWFKHGYGMHIKTFKQNLKSYSSFYPLNKDKIFYLNKNNRYKFKLAYSIFLAETFVLLPFYNKNKIPFIFTLYPGGAFGLNNIGSDNMLREIFSSPYFRRVIVTQQITKNYLIDKKMCPADKIDFLFLGYSQFDLTDALSKRFYKSNKNTFDICFVANKYSKQGVDKGYDLFVQVAKILCKKYDDVRFHVVGGFYENEIDISDIKNKISFYGHQQPSFLKLFYANMDICLSPNRPFKLFKGNFDGFPLGFECMFLQTALFVTDELNCNNNYFNSDEIVIIKPEVNNIISKIDYYYQNLDKLYDLSKKGSDKINLLANPKERLSKISVIITTEACKL